LDAGCTRSRPCGLWRGMSLGRRQMALGEDVPFGGTNGAYRAVSASSGSSPVAGGGGIGSPGSGSPPGSIRTYSAHHTEEEGEGHPHSPPIGGTAIAAVRSRRLALVSDSGADGGPLVRARRFSIPSAVYLCSLLLQAVGRFAATRYYVQAMEDQASESASGRLLAALEPYDCVAGVGRWKDLWSENRKAYCCSKWTSSNMWPESGAQSTKDECSPLTKEPRAGGSSSSIRGGGGSSSSGSSGGGATTAKTTALPSTSSGRQTPPDASADEEGPHQALPSCKVTSDNWEEDWSATTKIFCCSHWETIGILPKRGKLALGAWPSIKRAARVCCVVLGKESICPKDDHGDEDAEAAEESVYTTSTLLSAKASIQQRPVLAVAAAPLPEVVMAARASVSIRDSFTDIVMWQGAPVQPLEVVPLLLVVTLLVALLVADELDLWVKCCLCGIVMSVLQGFQVWAAASDRHADDDWGACQERLGPELLHEFESARNIIDIVRCFFSSLGAMGLWTNRAGFCADTLLSAQMCASIVFSLGLYELVWFSSGGLGFAAQIACRLSVGLVLFLIIACDLIFDLVSRFHLSWNVMLALAVVMLLWPNHSVGVAARSWAALLTERCSDDLAKRHEEDPELGALLEPCLCVPVCCFPSASLQHERLPQEAALEEERLERRALARRLEEASRGLAAEAQARGLAEGRRDAAEERRGEVERALLEAQGEIEEAENRHFIALEEVEREHRGRLYSTMQDFSRREKEADEGRVRAERRATATSQAFGRALAVISQTGSEVPPQLLRSLSGNSLGTGLIGASALASAAAAAERDASPTPPYLPSEEVPSDAGGSFDGQHAHPDMVRF